MEITAEQFAQVEPYLPRQRGNVLHQNLAIINAVLWLEENDCKWSALPKRFGSWHTVYTRVNRWAKSGVLDRVFEQMQRLQLIRVRLEVVSPDNSSLEGRPDGPRAPRKTQRKSAIDEPPKFTWVPRVRVCHRRRALAAAARRRSGMTALVTLRARMADRAPTNY